MSFNKEDKTTSFDVVKPIFFGDPIIFDEKGSTYIAMRKTQWLKSGSEPDESKAKLELRKWRVTPEGEERPDKGFSFLTDNGPSELAKVLIENGYGDTKEILLQLKKRDNFKASVDNLFTEDNTSNTDGEYFDMRNALLSEEDEAEEE